MAQGLTADKKIGIHTHKKAISTGAMTRIVTNIMEQNKASLKIFFLQLVLLWSVFNLFVLFSNNTYTAAFMVWILGSNLKVIIRNVISMHVKLSVVMLTICKSHFHIYS